ncbi:MAG: hypothetical protein WC052_03470 [Patescibacteria group bacterium]
MDIHPIVVHFPIALLTVYVGLEFLRFRIVLALPWWRYAKALFLLPGTIGAGVALLTGDIAGESFGAGGDFLRILELHELAAQTTTIIFSVLAVCYVLVVATEFGLLERLSGRVAKGLPSFVFNLARIAERVVSSWLAPVTAMAGLMAVTLTGGLGGLLVYGPDLDPITKLLYRLIVGG